LQFFFPVPALPADLSLQRSVYLATTDRHIQHAPEQNNDLDQPVIVATLSTAEAQARVLANTKELEDRVLSHKSRASEVEWSIEVHGFKLVVRPRFSAAAMPTRKASAWA